MLGVASDLGLTMHPTATVVSIEGPRFSSRAESNFFRMLDADIINMSLVPEAPLAAEAGMAYCAIAMCTDYDSWKDDEEDVTVSTTACSCSVHMRFTFVVRVLGSV